MCVLDLLEHISMYFCKDGNGLQIQNCHKIVFCVVCFAITGVIFTLAMVLGSHSDKS